MNLTRECTKQFELLKNTPMVNSVILKPYEADFFSVYKQIFFINYLANRVETKNFFDTDYYKISFSCLVEANLALLSNYSRGSSLLLRSSLESMLKHLIITLDKNSEIDDRQYSKNYDALKKSKSTNSKIKERVLLLNEKMKSLYSNLSSISHSLTELTNENVYKYFSDNRDLNKKSVSAIMNFFEQLVNYTVEISLYLSLCSLENWDTEDLDSLLSLVYGNKRKEKMIRFIKCK